MANLSYTYTASVPQGTQQINQTQTPIENNFEDIAQLFAVNHTPFNTSLVPDANVGLHNLVTYFGQVSNPTAVAGAINMYSKPVANDPNLYELFYQYPSGTVAQLTGLQSTNSTNASVNSGGIVVLPTSGNPVLFQYLSGGLLLMSGSGVSFGSKTGTNIFSFPVAAGLPVFTQTPFIMQFANAYSGGGIFCSINPISATQFSITTGTSAIGGTFAWLAIGV